MIALVIGALSPWLYLEVRTLAKWLGYDMFPMFVSLPNSLELLWPVAPGAALAAWLLDWTLGPFRPGTLLRRLATGTLLGGVLGWANAPVAALLALLWHLTIVPDAVTVPALLWTWLNAIPVILVLSAPIALPCGAFLGFTVATMGALEVDQAA
ncbi:MAG: hypothetical protein AMXMBFR33_18570 [Candidatus Xenobia bacterium]